MMNTNRQEAMPTETAMSTETAVSTGSEFQRLSVNISDESAEILRRVIDERGINATEATRRAIGLLAMFEGVTPASTESDPSLCESGGESGGGSAIENERW